MPKPHGITIQLEVKTQTGIDALHTPVYSSEYVDVDNVLVGTPSTEERTDIQNLTGKRIQFWIGIPRGDAHQWEDRKIILPAPFSLTVKTFGFKETAIQDLIPLQWGARIAAEGFSYGNR